jgi:hypothetical protein
VSKIHEEIEKHNLRSKEDMKSAAIEHMAELESKRIAAERSMQFSVKMNWERLIERRKITKVLRQLPLSQLQQN